MCGAYAVETVVAVVVEALDVVGEHVVDGDFVVAAAVVIGSVEVTRHEICWGNDSGWIRWRETSRWPCGATKRRWCWQRKM